MEVDPHYDETIALADARGITVGNSSATPNSYERRAQAEKDPTGTLSTTAVLCVVSERQDTLLAAIRQPDLQEPDPHPGRERYWLRCRAPFPFRWMRVVVEFAGDADRFVTAFGQDNDPEGAPR